MSFCEHGSDCEQCCDCGCCIDHGDCQCAENLCGEVLTVFGAIYGKPSHELPVSIECELPRGHEGSHWAQFAWHVGQ